MIVISRALQAKPRPWLIGEKDLVYCSNYYISLPLFSHTVFSVSCLAFDSNQLHESSSYSTLNTKRNQLEITPIWCYLEGCTIDPDYARRLSGWHTSCFQLGCSAAWPKVTLKGKTLRLAFFIRCLAPSGPFVIQTKGKDNVRK